MFCVWPPCPLGWALFAPVWTFLRLLFFGLSKSDCFVVHLGSFVCVATGASVHRRGRCIGVSLPLANDTSLVLVLVCLSVDVTGALALPNSFCFDCLHVLHAPPPICPFCHLAILWSGVSCLSSAVSVMSSPLFVVFVCLCAWCPVGFVSSCFLWLRGLGVLFCSVCSSRFWCRFRCFRVACSPLLFPVSVRLASPAPRLVSFVFWSSLHSCVLVPPSEYLVAAVTALLPCFHAGSVV